MRPSKLYAERRLYLTDAGKHVLQHGGAMHRVQKRLVVCEELADAKQGIVHVDRRSSIGDRQQIEELRFREGEVQAVSGADRLIGLEHGQTLVKRGQKDHVVVRADRAVRSRDELQTGANAHIGIGARIGGGDPDGQRRLRNSRGIPGAVGVVARVEHDDGEVALFALEISEESGEHGGAVMSRDDHGVRAECAPVDARHGRAPETADMRRARRRSAGRTHPGMYGFTTHHTPRTAKRAESRGVR